MPAFWAWAFFPVPPFLLGRVLRFRVAPFSTVVAIPVPFPFGSQVPDSLTRYVLRRAGFECRDERTVRLASLAAQRFLASVLEDSANIAKRRRLGPAAHLRAEGLGRERTLVLTVEDAAEALQDAGVSVRPAPYYVDTTAPPQ